MQSAFENKFQNDSYKNNKEYTNKYCNIAYKCYLSNIWYYKWKVSATSINIIQIFINERKWHIVKIRNLNEELPKILNFVEIYKIVRRRNGVWSWFDHTLIRSSKEIADVILEP